MLNAFLVALYLAFYVHWFIVKVAALFVAAAYIQLSWYWILLQFVLAFALELLLYVGLYAAAHDRSGSSVGGGGGGSSSAYSAYASNALDLATGSLSVLAIVFLYPIRRPSAGDYLVRYVGAPNCIALLSALAVVSYIIKRLWMTSYVPSTLYGRMHYLLWMTVLVWGLDSAAFFSHETTLGRILPLAVVFPVLVLVFIVNTQWFSSLVFEHKNLIVK